MSMTTPPAQTEPPAEKPPRRPWTLAWRLAATLGILVGAILVAGLLGNPRRFASPHDETLWQKPAAPAGIESTGPVEPKLTSEQKKALGQDNLRRMLGRILDKAGERPSYSQDDPLRRSPEERRQHIADMMGLAPEELRADVPAGLVPTGAEVLMVLQPPDSDGMVVVRLRMGIVEAMSAFQALYGKDQWQADEPKANPRTGGPDVETDKGWLVRYTRGRQTRFVFLEKREGHEETLAIVYDSRY